MSKPILLITRPKKSAEQFAGEVEARFPQHFDIIIAPLVEIEALFPEVLEKEGDALIFTSARAVEYSKPLFTTIKHAYCVGETTAKRCAKQGITIVESSNTISELIPALNASPYTTFIYPHGDPVSQNLADSLAPSKTVIDYTLYKQVFTPFTKEVLSKLVHKRIILPVFSQNMARFILKSFKSTSIPLTKIDIIGISAQSVQPFLAHDPHSISVAAAPNQGEILKMLTYF